MALSSRRDANRPERSTHRLAREVIPREDPPTVKSHRLLPLVAAGFLLLSLSDSASAQSRVDRNVVYGMYSGTALLLDVHYPAKPNGFGVIFIPGSGWSAPLGYAAPPLKESDQVGMYVPSLTEAGYTVFAITHRAT